LTKRGRFGIEILIPGKVLIRYSIVMRRWPNFIVVECSQNLAFIIIDLAKRDFD
jgi:hypothetical protein